MSAIKNYYHDQICAEQGDEPINEHQPGFDKGVWFQDADSGNWFTNVSDSDNIMAVRVNGEQFDRPAYFYVDNDKEFIATLDDLPF